MTTDPAPSDHSTAPVDSTKQTPAGPLPMLRYCIAIGVMVVCALFAVLLYGFMHRIRSDQALSAQVASLSAQVAADQAALAAVRERAARAWRVAEAAKEIAHKAALDHSALPRALLDDARLSQWLSVAQAALRFKDVSLARHYVAAAEHLCAQAPAEPVALCAVASRAAASLAAVHVVDVNALYHALGSLGHRLDAAMALPARDTPALSHPSQPVHGWAALKGALGRLIHVEPLSQGSHVSPWAAQQTRARLRLQLAVAQWAVLTQRASVYESALADMRALLQAAPQAKTPAVQQLLAALLRLSHRVIDPPLPVIFPDEMAPASQADPARTAPTPPVSSTHRLHAL